MSDPASWLVVESGWRVIGADGVEVGTVEAIVGDEEKDIFSGVRVVTGVLRAARFVPAEHVARIDQGEVHLDLAADEAREREFAEPGAGPHPG